MTTKLLILTGLLVAVGNLFAGTFRQEIGGKPFIRWMATLEAKHSPREIAIMADDEVWFDFYRHHWTPEGAYRSIRKQNSEIGKWISLVPDYRGGKPNALVCPENTECFECDHRTAKRYANKGYGVVFLPLNKEP